MELYIPVLIASTGSNLDAAIAGRIPDINPIIAANPVPKTILPILKTNSKSTTFVKITEIIQTNKNLIHFSPDIILKIVSYMFLIR